MAVYENPNNGYRESVGGLSILWAFLFGLFYLAVKGLWTHVFITVLLMFGSFLLMGPVAIPVVFIVWVVYALAVPSLLRTKYLRQGWREVR